LAEGQWTAAELEFRAALQSAEERDDEHYARIITHNLGLPAMMRGDFGEALRWLRRLIREGAPDAPVPQEVWAHLNMARCHLYRGDLAECEQHLDRALERCQLFNLVAQRAETFETYGNLYRERGDVARAKEFYERAARAYDDAGISPARCELLEEQALLRLQVGDLTGARAQIERLVEARSEDGNDLARHTARLTRGRILLAQGHAEEARADLEPALRYFRAHGLYYYEVQACASLAACAGDAGRDDAETLDLLRRALDLAARYDYEYWLQREVAENPRLFVAQEVAELLPPELREQTAPAVASTEAPAAEDAEAPHAAALAAIESKPVVDLTINMLGPVEIFRDPARPFAADAWTTKRARDILCFVASRPHRRASKDTIIDTFWGESDPKVIEKNFHPTISHIRKALNSNQPLKQNFLLYRDGDYQLNPEFSYRVDTEEFDRLVNEGEAARREREVARCINCYEEAIALYRGEFVQGGYDDWVEEPRAYYREQYLRMLEALAAVALKTEDWPRSLKLSQQILREDSFREDIHCMVMRAQGATGNRAAVKEQYEVLRRLLRKELGVEPAAETQKVYRELMGADAKLPRAAR
jgi:DNA-binding SARP family transcriptional activator/tetratricopeptide (TPR) repeat protein